MSAPPPPAYHSVYPPTGQTQYAQPYPQAYGGDFGQQSGYGGVSQPPIVDTKRQGYNPPQPQYQPQSSAAAYPPAIDSGISNPNYGRDEAAANSSSLGDEGQWAGSSFSSKAIRLAFIRKVYLILCSQLLVTLAFIAIFLYVAPVKSWVQHNGWFYYISYAVFLITYIVLVCCPSVRRQYPGNFICLSIFTLAFSYMVATISSFYDTTIVLVAVAITAAVCLGVTCFAIQTKYDFTMCGGLLFMLVLVLFMFGISCIIVYATVGYSYIMQCVYGGLGALLFSLFLAYDTQMLIGGKKIELSPEEYIYGSLQLYLDVCYIFIFLLSMFGSKN